MGKRIREVSRKEDEDSVRAMVEKQGLVVKTVTAETYDSWKQEIDKNQAGIRGDVVPEDVYDQVMRHLDEYRSRVLSTTL